MKILILHRIPYHKIDYHRGIDHERHEVIYLGIESALATIPDDLRCERWLRLGEAATELEAIEILKQKQVHVDRVISLSEYELMSAAIVRQAFDIPGASIEQTNLVRNKLVMKEAVEQAGLRVPKNMSLRAYQQQGSANWQGKTVLKPVDGASSENVLIFASLTEMDAALQQQTTGVTALDNGDWDDWDVEEFVEGDIIHIDGLTFDGELQLVVASKYIGTCLGFADGEPLGSVQIDTDACLRRWTAEILAAVQIDAGSFHLEAIQHGDELVFLEVANRVGGADVVDAVEQASGVHLPSAELQAYLGETPAIPDNINLDRKFGWFVFPGHHLDQEYCDVRHAEPFKDSEFVLRWNQLTPDKPLTRHITYQSVEVPVAGLVGAAQSDQLEQFMKRMFAEICVV